MALVIAQLCGQEECSSPCHQPGHLGPYCAPLRCYCGGCPAHEPLEDSLVRARRLAEAEAWRMHGEWLAARPAEDGVPLDRAPAEVQAMREQLRTGRAEDLGPARWQALQDRRQRDRR